jgi:hypothetical protein
VIGALTLGLVISRHLVRLDGLDASPEELTAVAGPLIEELTTGTRAKKDEPTQHPSLVAPARQWSNSRFIGSGLQSVTEFAGSCRSTPE